MLEEFELLDWKRRIFELYRRVQHQSVTDPVAAWNLWRSGRDELFRTHPQSPLPPPERDRFEGLSYYDYDPSFRFTVEVEEAAAHRFEIPTSDDSTMSFTRFATAYFDLDGSTQELELYWLDSYGGGIFVPFRDETSGKETYGAGRYLLDTVKGADLGMQDGKQVFDFNFAYNPSCSYDDKWACPLAPPPNHMAVEVRAGELLL